MLGINTVKNLALSTAVMDNLNTKKKSLGLDMEGFWRHSLCVAVAAKFLAKKRGIDSKMIEEYFTAGLLHDIGKIPLNAVLSQQYMVTVSNADRERKPLTLAEENIFGMNHCEAGGMIADAWKLDGAIGDAIKYHHSYREYAGDNKDILYSVAVAKRFATLSVIGFSGECHPSPLPDFIWDVLDVSKDVFDEIVEKVNVEIEKAEVFLKISRA
jgi:putative nucleotidyltransferase with HDIG domain